MSEDKTLEVLFGVVSIFGSITLGISGMFLKQFASWGLLYTPILIFWYGFALSLLLLGVYLLASGFKRRKHY